MLGFLYQQIKRARITFLGTFDKLLIRFPSAHSHAPPARTTCVEPYFCHPF